jgi:hypothetical protein
MLDQVIRDYVAPLAIEARGFENFSMLDGRQPSSTRPLKEAASPEERSSASYR